MNSTQLSALLVELLSLPAETEWVEWKHNNDHPEMIANRSRRASPSLMWTARIRNCGAQRIQSVPDHFGIARRWADQTVRPGPG
jgi:hypothetical protein